MYAIVNLSTGDTVKLLDTHKVAIDEDLQETFSSKTELQRLFNTMGIFPFACGLLLANYGVGYTGEKPKYLFEIIEIEDVQTNISTDSRNS